MKTKKELLERATAHPALLEVLIDIRDILNKGLEESHEPLNEDK